MASIQKPKALAPGDRVRVLAPAAPACRERVEAGIAELRRLGYAAEQPPERIPQGYFAASTEQRARDLGQALRDSGVRAVVAARAGYGSNYLLAPLEKQRLRKARILVGFSDLTTLSIWLWQKRRWITFYGPMAASGFVAGAGADGGYDEDSFRRAVTQTRGGWTVELGSEPLDAGSSRPASAPGTLLGGCLTLLETSLGTDWELGTRGSILVLEDVGMKPYQVDRALMHLLQAGKLRSVRGIILGEFPGCLPAEAGGTTVREVCARILSGRNIPMVWGARIGHTGRPMLTLPLGVRARLDARRGLLHILEPAVSS
jgi:muramoyltetrapeptide carboxypeptidase